MKKMMATIHALGELCFSQFEVGRLSCLDSVHPFKVFPVRNSSSSSKP